MHLRELFPAISQRSVLLLVANALLFLGLAQVSDALQAKPQDLHLSEYSVSFAPFSDITLVATAAVDRVIVFNPAIREEQPTLLTLSSVFLFLVVFWLFFQGQFLPVFVFGVLAMGLLLVLGYYYLQGRQYQMTFKLKDEDMNQQQEEITGMKSHIEQLSLLISENQDLEQRLLSDMAEYRQQALELNIDLERDREELLRNRDYLFSLQQGLRPETKGFQKHFKDVLLWHQTTRDYYASMLWLHSSPEITRFALVEVPGYTAEGAFAVVLAYGALNKWIQQSTASKPQEAIVMLQDIYKAFLPGKQDALQLNSENLRAGYFEWDQKRMILRFAAQNLPVYHYCQNLSTCKAYTGGAEDLQTREWKFAAGDYFFLLNNNLLEYIQGESGIVTKTEFPEVLAGLLCAAGAGLPQVKKFLQGALEIEPLEGDLLCMGLLV